VSRSSAAGTKAVETALLCARQLGEIHAEGGGHDSSVTGSALKVRNNKNAQSSSLVRKRYDEARPGSSGAFAPTNLVSALALPLILTSICLASAMLSSHSP
jgi:hypothetical protein